MKHRILFTLCMLLATWGMAKAQSNIELTIPAGNTEESVTVTIKNTEPVLKVGTEPYYPVFTSPITPTLSNKGKTATYTIPVKATAQTFTVTTQPLSPV